MANNLSVIQQTSEELLGLMGVKAQVVVEENDGAYLVQVESPETGILIGYHGETLTALQLILGQITYKRTGEWLRLTVNIGDYTQKRQEQLRQMVDSLVEKVKEQKTSETLPYLNARERRYIHMYLQAVDGVKTESVGEGRERRLVIFPTFEKK